MQYANIVVCKKIGEFDEPLTYAVPAALKETCRPGCFTVMPLRGRSVQGIVASMKDQTPAGFDPQKIKSFHAILPDIGLFPQQVELAFFIAAYYHTSLARAFRLMVPRFFWEGRFKGPESLPPVPVLPLKAPGRMLNPSQERALLQMQRLKKPVLLHGVTGSGKTELYLRVILEQLRQGKSSILLVPEIALTPQMTEYFKVFFGSAMVIFHSRLTEKKRAEEWWKVRFDRARLVIGSRSAVFAPVRNLGALILDEEHEWTYKQESAPYYETHRIAEKLAALHGAQLILGSATPRLESYEKARRGDYTLVTLPDRVHSNTFPKIIVVDLREEFKKKNFSVFSLLLQKKIAERLQAGQQTILFVNQRGLARAVLCRDCGYTEQCSRCEVSLKYHKFQSSADQLVCHYCSFKKIPPLLCPECRSPYIRQVGVGTQKVEAEVRKFFPSARVIRADKDTTSKKEGFQPIYKAFLNRDYDILVGTQMVAKGLDFSSVSLIGIVLADIGLNIPDFRSHERTFQLITQVAGRCGRSDQNPGEVVLQTYQPDHPAIAQAARYGYADFAERELGFRKKLGYPPFNRLIKFTVVGADPERLRRHIEESQETLEDIANLHHLPLKIASAPALFPKIANRYYYHVLLRGKAPDQIFRHWRLPKGWRVDIDPVHMS